ncbi:MAG: isocitrate/isopropylmalate dehydrogenase family protein [Caldilineaceae bacterium]|nr:isocitrate/isopropylmalate dehydrogenase family protein [Caldilineaceae bacterium]
MNVAVNKQNLLYKIGVIPGDGIGQEVTPVAVDVLRAAGLPATYIELEAGWDTFQATGSALPDATLAALTGCDGAIFGAVSSPSGSVPGYASPIIALRKALDLYANLRPIRSAPLLQSRVGVDLLIVRENTECLYVKEERLEDDGRRAVATRVITADASTRIARKAFDLARARANARGRRGFVTIVHKANVLSVSDGLFRACALAVAEEYSDVAVEEQLVDSMAYRLILEPERYDVIVAPNLYGDILSDEAAALTGGLGLVPSANAGDGFALVEPVHGSAPDIAGQGIANPVASVRAAALLCAALGQETMAAVIEEAVTHVLAHGPRTRDLGGNATTQAVAEAIIEQVNRLKMKD